MALSIDNRPLTPRERDAYVRGYRRGRQGLGCVPLPTDASYAYRVGWQDGREDAEVMRGP